MASSRLEKIGNIFTRIEGLLKSGAMKWEDKPLFYEIYQAFPPLRQRQYNEPGPRGPVRQIFYAEDIDRASRDDSATTFNLSEASVKRQEPSYPYQRQPQMTTPQSTPKDQPKLFNLNELEDLKA